jgi:hypothetical protein
MVNKRRKSDTVTSGTPRSGTLHPASYAYEIANRPMINPKRVEPANGISGRKLEFANLLWQGYSGARCYDMAYTSHNAPRKTVWLKALWLARDPQVKERMLQLETVELEGVMNEHERRKSLVLSTLEGIAVDSDMQPGPRVKALELLGKVRGTDLFDSKVDQPMANLSQEQVKQQLVERLASVGLTLSDVEAKPDATPRVVLALPKPDATDAEIVDDDTTCSSNEGTEPKPTD